MRNFIHFFIVTLCFFIAILLKFILDDSFDDFLTVKLSNIKTLKERTQGSSLTEALKKRFVVDQKNHTSSLESTKICENKMESHSNFLIYKEKFSKLSKNFLIGKNLRSKYLRILNLANNYLAFNQTQKQKTGTLSFLY